MAVCGIEIQGNEAFFVSLDGTREHHHLVAPSFRKISLSDHTNQDIIHSFFQTVQAHLRDANISKIGIRARQTKGNYAGGSITFKIEGILQMVDVPVSVIHPLTLQKTLRNCPPSQIPDEIYKYQQNAYEVAYHLLEAE